MRFEHQGMSLWHGTHDAPVTAEIIDGQAEVTICVGAHPANADNAIELRYRINRGPTQIVHAEWQRSVQATRSHYFTARLPPMHVEDTVDYSAVCRSAGRQVPSLTEFKDFTASFRVSASEEGRAVTLEVQPGSSAPGAPASLGRQHATTASRIADPGHLDTNRRRTPPPRGASSVVSQRSISTESLSPHSEQRVISGTVRGAAAVAREGITVQAFARDLPSVEGRAGSEPPMIGEGITGADGRFQINYTLGEFSRGTNTVSSRLSPGKPTARRPRRKPAHLSFRVLDATGTALVVTRMNALNREFEGGDIVFRAPPFLEVSISVEHLPQCSCSEFERVAAEVATFAGAIALADMTDEDVSFLCQELGREDEQEFLQSVAWLSRCTRLARDTTLPVEAFYGWGRMGAPAPLAELAATHVIDLPNVLIRLLVIDSKALAGMLVDAVTGNIIPAGLRNRVDEIVTQIEQLKVRKGVVSERRFYGRLLDAASGHSLEGFTVEAFDLDGGAERRLDKAVSDTDGVFSVVYTTPATQTEANDDGPRRRIRLHIVRDPRQPPAFDTEVRAGSEREVLDVQVPVPDMVEPESQQLTSLSTTLPATGTPRLLETLASHNIATLADIRKAGGVRRLAGVDMPGPALRLFEAHADLSRISRDVQVNAAMIKSGFESVDAIAMASRPDFVGRAGAHIGDFEATQLQVAARAQTGFLNSLLFQKAADHANGFATNPLVAPRVTCSCRDCEAAVSPLAYLADLLKYVVENVTSGGTAITVVDLVEIFHQAFDAPASCEAAEAQVRQVRLCIEVLRSVLGARPLADVDSEVVLADAERTYRQAAYAALLTAVGTSYVELRLLRSREPSVRQSLADRLGIDLGRLSEVFLDADAPAPGTLTEAALEQLFGLVDTTRDPFEPAGIPRFQTWRLEHLRTLWKDADFPPSAYEDSRNIVTLEQLPVDVVIVPPLAAKVTYDADRQQMVCQGEITTEERSTLLALSPEPEYQQAIKRLFQASQRLPIIDPDVIGPDDYRRPVPTASDPTDPNGAFDLWKTRRDWLDARQQVLSEIVEAISVEGKIIHVPDITALLAAMYQPVTYGTTSVTPWATTTPSGDLEMLREQLTRGVDVSPVTFRLEDDLNLTVEGFLRLMAIADKATAWKADFHRQPVSDAEWRELYAILMQCQKIELFAAWRQEEHDAGVHLDPNTFWISLREPEEGDWPPLLSAGVPLIDPATVKVKDLPEPVAGHRAIAIWRTRQSELDHIAKDLAAEKQQNGFGAMLRLALGHPKPRDPLEYDLNALKANLSNPDPTVVAAAKKRIIENLYLTTENFTRLLAIQSKHDDPDLQKKPTADEWAQVYANLTRARKIKHAFPAWISEEQDSASGLVYWTALKATLPRWRASRNARQIWQQALLNHSQPALVDPDLIAPADFANPVAGDPAFDIWTVREGEISSTLTQYANAPKHVEGLDATLKSALNVALDEFLAIQQSDEIGGLAGQRFAQLSLEIPESAYLLRVATLATKAQPILDSEWENVYSILVQAWKRRQAARWREEERDNDISLCSDSFQISAPVPLTPAINGVSAGDMWRSPRAMYQDWQDRLQSRLDQEKAVKEALTEAAGATEDETLSMLRDALVRAIPIPGEPIVKAEWIARNLIIDAETDGCALTTRVAQAIETLHGLVLALRSGDLSDPFKTFSLDLDSFDEKWRWLGSYASWRAAMFVFLYPENILQPSLRKPEWQSPAFRALAKQTGASRRLTAADACVEAKAYSEYFQDICTLRVEASCASYSRLATTQDCNSTDNGYRSFFYMFGRGGVTGKVYWSAYELQDEVAQARTLWAELVGSNGAPIKDWDNIIEISGASAYQSAPGKRYLYLFGRKRESAKLLCARYDLINGHWLDELLTLDTPFTGPVTNAAIKQQWYENEPPVVAFCDLEISSTARLSENGEQWWTDPFTDKPFDPVHWAGKAEAILPASYGGFFLIVSEADGALECRLYVPKDVPRPALFDLGSRYKMIARVSFSTYGPQTYLGSGTDVANGIYIVFGSPGQAWASVYTITDVGTPELNTVLTVGTSFPIRPRVIPVSGVLSSAWAAYQTDAAFLAKRPIGFEVGARVMPANAGPFDIPQRLSAQELLIRKDLIRTAYLKNEGTVWRPSSPLNVVYPAEAYYFVPIQLALALQRSGEYVAALDLLRTVYDYTAEVSARKIYYGLVAEESAAHTYVRGADWLLDPLNPHVIAATRQHTYTRFTVLAIIRCLLDYGDAEFTQDTPESNPLARRLYSTALALFEAPELAQGSGKCEAIIGVLDDVPVADDRWLSRLRQLKSGLRAISDPQTLEPLVERLRQALSTDRALDQRFGDARSILKRAVAALPPAPTLTVVMQESDELSRAARRAAFSDSSLAGALESVGATAAQNFQHAVASVAEPPWPRVLGAVHGYQPERMPPAGGPQEPGAHERTVSPRDDPARRGVVGSIYRKTPSAAHQPVDAFGPVARAQKLYVPQLIVGFCIPSNPLLKTLRLRAELNLHKLRTCRNIAGLKRQLEPYAAPTDTSTGLPAVGSGGALVVPGAMRLQPTLYRYQVLVERAKQLIQLAGQLEAALLSTLVQRDAEAYNVLRARQDLNLAQASVRLQTLRVTEATDGVQLAALQTKRAEQQVKSYQDWIKTGLNEYEKAMINAYQIGAAAQNASADSSHDIQLKQAAIASAQLAAQIGNSGNPYAVATGVVAGAGNLIVDAILFDQLRDNTRDATNAAAAAQIASVKASFELRKQDWELQALLATQDVAIGEQQVTLANDHVGIVHQEKAIEELRTRHAKDAVEFLTTKFTNSDLYEWMSGILEGVYRFFLQQATATAKLAENQLAFERQEVPPAYVQADYWNIRVGGTTSSNGGSQADRKGLTGSARLLQDIYQLDQYAFNTGKRKMPLTKSLSLASLVPVEFERFRETGVLPFATPMELFDRGFPGHYLRLIKRVRTSIIALVPPAQGVHATLSTTGPSRVVIGGDVFQTVSIRRGPEFIALSAPTVSTNVFELEGQPDMLLPFEGSGVEMNWEFSMPKAANLFDYDTIADVLVTLEYTALHSHDYRQQVIQALKPTVSADRPFSLRNQFADQWYDLHNPDQTSEPMTVRFATRREDFPPNIEGLKIQQLLLYFVSGSEAPGEVAVTHLRYTSKDAPGNVGGSATSVDGIISTRRGNAGSWTATIGKSPVGDWELALPNTEEMRNRLRTEELRDILLVISYSGRTPAWPA